MEHLPLNTSAGDGDTPFSGFGHLMPNRVQEILLVASMYDAFTLEEGGRLTELLLNEYRELNLSFAPKVTRASTGEEALALIDARDFDMVITMTRLGDMEATDLATAIKEKCPDLPIYNLAFNPRELQHLQAADGQASIDRYFLWNGDVRLLLGIIKYCEDELNVAHDTRLRRRALHPADRGLGPFLFVLSADALHRGAGADPEPDGRGRQPEPPPAAAAGPAQDPAGQHLRGSLGSLSAIQGFAAGRHLRRAVPLEGSGPG